MNDWKVCPWCDGRGATCPHQPNGQPGRQMHRCDKCRGTGRLKNGTIPGLPEPIEPTPAKVEKIISRGQLSLFDESN